MEEMIVVVRYCWKMYTIHYFEQNFVEIGRVDLNFVEIGRVDLNFVEVRHVDLDFVESWPKRGQKFDSVQNFVQNFAQNSDAEFGPSDWGGDENGNVLNQSD